MKFRLKGVHHGIARRHGCGSCLAAVIEQCRFAEIFAFATDHGKLEDERCPIEMNFESMVKRSSLLIDRATGGCDGQILFEAKLRGPAFGQLASHASGRGDRLGHAEEQADEMGIVDMQIQHRASNGIGFPVMSEPGRVRNDAAETPATEFAIASALNNFASPGIFRK